MNPHLVAPIVFGCIFATTLLGMRLSAALPKHHLSTDTKDVVRVGASDPRPGKFAPAANNLI